VSAEDDIFDAVTRHQIFVLRYAKGREREAEGFIARQLEEVIYRIESDNLTAFGRSRAQAQATDLYQYLLASNKEYAEQYKADLTQFGQYEAEFNQTMMQKRLGIDLSLPAPIQIQQAAFTGIMGLEPSKGYTLGGMLDDFGPAHANLVVDQIRSSIVLGDTTDELTRGIRGLVPLQSRKAATLARTAVNHVSVQARKETLKENDDVLLGYEWVATLDSRTSLICMSRDGVIYKDYDRDPKPPAHFNCRSTIVPKVNPEYDLGADIIGTRAAKGSGGAGQVSAGLNYDQWLRKQSEPFQNKVLGKGRAKLFRKGMTIDKFVDNRGKTLTLTQLRRDDAEFVMETPITPNVSLSGRVRFDDINQCNNLTAEQLSQFLDDSLTETQKRLVTSLPRPSRIFDNEPKGAFYRSLRKELHQPIDRDRGLPATQQTFAHEYGHHIDYELSEAGLGSLGPVRLRAWSERSPEFKKAFLDDRKDLGLKMRKTMEGSMDELSAELFNPITKMRKNGTSYESKDPKAEWSTGVSDIIDAMTGGRFYADGHWGHGVSYYRDRGSKEKETFANLFSLRGNAEAWAYCQRKFPRLCKVFDDAVDEYLNTERNFYDG
jgi:SPP1 gp7 family putative phage head morphogenesis protein